MLLLIAPKNKVKIIPKTRVMDEIKRFLSEQDDNNFLHPTKRLSDTKKRIVETEKRTENFLMFKINKETIDKIPAKNAHAAVIPNPMILSE